MVLFCSKCSYLQRFKYYNIDPITGEYRIDVPLAHNYDVEFMEKEKRFISRKDVSNYINKRSKVKVHRGAEAVKKEMLAGIKRSKSSL